MRPTQGYQYKDTPIPADEKWAWHPARLNSKDTDKLEDSLVSSTRSFSAAAPNQVARISLFRQPRGGTYRSEVPIEYT
jgi:hypothetical protein